MTDLASNGTPIDVLTEQDWDTPYGLGKFDTVGTEKVHSWTLTTNQSRECGNSTDWHWWAAGFDADGTDDMPGGPLGGGVIIQEDSQGAVTGQRFGTRSAYLETWAALEKEYDEYVHGECADGTECDGCPECEYR